MIICGEERREILSIWVTFVTNTTTHENKAIFATQMTNTVNGNAHENGKYADESEIWKYTYEAVKNILVNQKCQI